MGEKWLRWQGRIGSFKSSALVLGLSAVILLAILIPNLRAALHNPTQPQNVQIGQLVRGEIGADRYVAVAGTAFYQAGYTETKDQKLVATIYALVDTTTGDTIFVRTTQPVPTVEHESVSLIGMTRAASADLRALIEKDLPDLQSGGLATTSNLYLADRQKPAAASIVMLGLAGAGLLLILCALALIFPGTVFRPSPVDATVVPVTGQFVTKASGHFQRLKQGPPAVELGNGTRRFREANANLVPQEAQRLMVYIHHIDVTKTYGITTSRNESHWAAFVDPGRTVDVQPGMLFARRDRDAVRMRYNDEEGKLQELILTFDEAGAQAGFLNALRERGFPVGTGSPVPA
jgi:hypothetical protein